jgi:hypothetical protein
MKIFISVISRFIILTLVVSGCAISFTHYREVKEFISREDYLSAAKKVEESYQTEYGEKNSLLFFLDLGILYHLAGDYEKSNRYFSMAEQRVDELYTKSISKQTASFLTSDNVKPYEGENFEKTLINLFMALNYILAGKIEDAIVEARKVNHKLELYNREYGDKLTYRDDAFVRYIMGMLYENNNEINDAFISYRKALYIYRYYQKTYGTLIPENLFRDCVRTGLALGFTDLLDEIKNDFSGQFVVDKNYESNEGEIVLLHLNGLAPYKIEKRLQVAFGNGIAYARTAEVSSDEQGDVNKAFDIAGSIAGDVNISVAFPEYKVRKPVVVMSTMSIYGNVNEVKSIVSEDVTAIALKDLEDRLGRIMAKTIARAAVKYAIAYAAGQTAEDAAKKKMGGEGGAVVGWLAKKAFSATASATENADRRAWEILPAEFRLAQIRVKPGVYSIVVKFYNEYGSIVSQKVFDNVRVEKGKRTFLEVATMFSKE